jgi:glycosyltransferase involved in cell wall biosynthesis
MAAGLSVITTPVGGIPEIIEDGETGLLFPPGDANALAEKITFLLNNKDVRIEIGKKARRKACAEMDFQVYVNKLRFHLDSFCAVKRRKEYDRH